MQFALAFISGFIALAACIRQPGVQLWFKWYIAIAPIYGFEYIAGSSEDVLLSSSISNNNLEASVTTFFPTPSEVYSPGDIIIDCTKFIAQLNQIMFLGTTLHQTSVNRLSLPYSIRYCVYSWTGYQYQQYFWQNTVSSTCL